MQSMEGIRVSAKTIEKAIQKAAVTFGVEKEMVAYRVISETKGGFLSFLGRKVEIFATPPSKQKFSKQPRRVGATHANKVSLSDREMSDLVEDLRSFCQGICKRMYRTDVEVLTTLEKDRLVLDIQCEEMSQQAMKNSKLPENLEHLLRKKPRHLKRELPFRVFVDVCGFRRARENELVDLAKDLSDKVHENKKPIVLNYRSSYDRKIIHMALDKDQRVYTRSIGSGANRKLMILPVKKKEIECT